MQKADSTPGDEDAAIKRRDVRRALDDEVAILIARCEKAQDQTGASSWNVGDSFFRIKHKVPGAQEIAKARLNTFNDIRKVSAPTLNEDPADARVKKIFAYDEPRNRLTFPCWRRVLTEVTFTSNSPSTATRISGFVAVNGTRKLT